MSTVYTWTIKHIQTMNSPTQGFVCRVFAEVTGSREGVSFSQPVDVSFTEPSETFIPYDQLKEDQVIGWVLSEVSPDRYDSVLRCINEAIDYQLNPPETPKLTPLPWVTE